MADIIATIDTSNETTATVDPVAALLTTSNLSNPAIVESLDNVGDIDVTTYGKYNGSVLVYKTTTNKWTSTTTLDAQNMEGGEF